MSFSQPVIWPHGHSVTQSLGHSITWSPRWDRSVRCKHTFVNARFSLSGGLIKQTTAATDWSVRLQRTDRSQHVPWSLGHSVTWSHGHSVSWSLGHLVTWWLGHLVTRSLGHSVTWSLGHSVTQLLSHSVTQLLSYSVTWSFGHYFQHYYELTNWHTTSGSLGLLRRQ